LPRTSEPTLAPSRFIARLVTGILALNLIAGTLVALMLYESRGQHEERAVVTAQNLSHLLEQDLAGSFDKIALTLLAIVDEATRLRSNGNLDASVLNAFIARQTSRLPELSDMRSADAQGNLRYGTGLSPDTLINVADREFFIRLRDHADAGLVVSKPIVSRTNGKWQIVLARRMNQSDGSFAGIVGAMIELDKITAKFSTLNIGRHGVINLRDHEQAVVARYSPIESDDGPLIGQKIISRQLEEQLRIAPEAGIYRAISPLDHLERAFSYRKLPSYPFYIFVGLSTDDYLGEWWREVAKNGILMAVFALVTLWFSRRMVGSWKRREADLDLIKQQEQKFRILLESSPSPLVIVDATGLIALVNRQVVALFGYEPEELVGQPIEVLLPQRYHGRHIDLRQGYTQAPQVREMGKDRLLWAVTKLGREVPINVSLSPIHTEQGLMVAASIRDISERKAAEEQIELLAYHDALTGLPNRRLLLDRLHQALAASARSDHYGALLFIDLDNFKTLNDTLGHDKGDLLLQQVAQRLATCVREGDTVARLGGDEFVAMLEGLSENHEEAAARTETVGEKILASLNQPYLLAGYEIRSTPSIGVTLFCGRQTSIDDMLKQADLAMYQAKSAGRNTLCFFDPEMQAIATNRAALEVELGEAVRQQQFILHYQPQVVGDGRLTGAEALLRWQHPQRGLVSPAEFIPLAEETGLILPLGHWVLQAACTQLAIWATRPGMAHLTVAVNVSANQLHQADFVEQVLLVLDRTGANPQRLKLELTESVLVSNVEKSIAKMSALKAHGVNFSLDDFGTGYSSLSYLKQLPLEQLKIDKGFVRDILTDPNDAAIAKMVIALAESMGLTVMAEGVEIEAQREFLARIGCHAYQGYLFSRPLPLDEFEEFVKRV
jgi:diguanylate cyclase (GGDEF)-like protein/PAS domain S-box-containing protein